MTLHPHKQLRHLRALAECLHLEMVARPRAELATEIASVNTELQEHEAVFLAAEALMTIGREAA